MHDAAVHVSFGKMGTRGQRRVGKFASESEAVAAAKKFVAEKLRKGYRPAPLD